VGSKTGLVAACLFRVNTRPRKPIATKIAPTTISQYGKVIDESRSIYSPLAPTCWVLQNDPNARYSGHSELLQRPQLARKELGDPSRPQRVIAIAIEALKLPAADIPAEQELHGFAALRAGWRRSVFGHDARLDQARALPNSLSPMNAETGAAMAKIKSVNLWLSARSPT
jgi:hypothetical protein